MGSGGELAAGVSSSAKPGTPAYCLVVVVMAVNIAREHRGW